jgi:ligand-binding sensor domain-containing protein/class 3 adenylate cyclase
MLVNTLKRSILALTLFAAAYVSVNAQTYYFDKYDVRDGLAQSKVYCIIQDKGGFLWLGTTIGVSKFDGTTFINYFTDNGLAENGVKCMLKDSRGILWLGHIGGGITRYDGKKFEKIVVKDIEIDHDITSIVEDDKGMIWLATVGDGVIRIENPGEPKANKFVYKQFKGKESVSDYVFSIYKRKDNMLFFITDLGLKTYNAAKNSFDFFKPDQMPSYFQLTCMYEDLNSNLWFGTYNGGLYKYEEKKGFIKIYDAVRDGLALNWISTISGDHNGNIWIGTWGGGITVIKNDKVIENFNDRDGMYDNKIWCIVEDREGNILLGTNENGLLIFKGRKFISFSKTDGLLNDQVWAIAQDNKGRIFFGTNEGMTIYSPDTKKYESFTTPKLVSKQVRFLKKDKNGNIWIGTNDNGVQLFHVNRNDFYYDLLINKFFPRSNSLVSALEVDKDNNLWIGTTEWLVYYEIDNNKITALSQGNGLAGNDISTIYCDSKNVVWVGSKRKGLTKIQGSKITKVDLKENFTPKCIVEDKEGKLWVGTEDRGIIVLKNDNIVKRIKSNDGLLSNNILTVNVDDDNNIFVGTSAGLIKYNQKSNKFHVYTEKSGFTGIEVKDNATFKDNEGNIWFGTIKGAIKYTKKYDIPNMLEPITFISRFRVNLNDRNMEEGIKLNYLDRSITFDFGSICLSNTQGIKYLFRLVGADQDWRSVVNNLTTVTYSPLPPGKYTFQVKAANNEGIWNKEPISYSFKINPPFWRTWWFYTIMSIIIITTLVLYIKIRERNLIKEKRILEEKVRERTAEVVKEKEKSEALLLNTLPVKVVDDLKKFGKTDPETFENVTVYFSDICTFTDISANLDPHDTINELNDLFTAFDDIMIKHRCERIKTIGDAYMAVCGLPEKDENHALNIARAAIEIRKFLEDRAASHDIKWRVRIGLNSGKVTGGIVGVRKYLYDIFGDTVNTASRMESNSEPMRINCSETTYQILKDKFRFTPRETTIVKGKGEMKMYFIEEELGS